VKKQWCIPELSAQFVWRMEDILELYEEPYDPKKPTVCFDELPYQLVSEKRIPLPAKSGRPLRYDYEYKREGVRNLFVFFEPKASWRHIGIRERRTAIDFAEEMRKLVDEHYPEAEKIRVVLDNLNTHTGAALYEAFEPQEARRILRKLQFHYTPKHGSWLNQAEIEFSVLCKECIGGRRISDEGMLKKEVGAWERERNEAGATIDWRFGVEDACTKLECLYPAGS
jgi:transposase